MQEKVLPSSEGFNQYGTEDTAVFITKATGEADFGGVAYKTASGVHNLGVYVVDAVYLRCGNPPPGYSTEQGRNGFRSDYWEMESIATMTDTSLLEYQCFESNGQHDDSYGQRVVDAK